MNLEDAFLRDIIANPDDDTPRLVCADWFEEQGDHPRAEFIRVQCRLAHMEADDPELETLRARGQVLLDQHRDRFVARMVHRLREAKVRAPDEALRFNRGFIEEVDLNLDDFLKSADVLFGLAPVQSLLFRSSLVYRRGKPDTLAALAACPHLTRIRALNLWSLVLAGERMRILTQSPYLTNLRELSVAGTDSGDEGVLALASSSLLQQLRSLDLSSNEFGPEALAALALSPAVANLRVLRLQWHTIGDLAARALIDSPHLDCLQTLDLEDCEGSRFALRALRARFGARLIGRKVP